mgnify:CR=1 FL=1
MQRVTMQMWVLLGLGGLLHVATGAEPKPVMVEVKVDSENPGYEGYRAMDGDVNSMWHTDFQFRETRPPHEMVVDFGASYEVSGFVYVPRTDRGNGTIGRYECFLSDNRKDFGQPVASGEFAPPSAETSTVT